MRFPNYPSCHVHQQSLDSASTPEAFAARELELDTGVLTVTDHGSLAACHKIYSLAKEKGLIPILGLEGYFRDDDCPILKAAGVPKSPEGGYQDHIKYHHITLHFLDQAAYECGVRLLSKADARAERHGSERKPLFDWAALEQLGSHNVTMTTGCLIGMVQRHIKEHEDFATAEAYYQRLRSIVKPGNFYVEIFPHVCDRNWNAGVFMTFEDGTETKYHDGKWIKTNAGEIQLIDLAAAFKRKDNPHGEVLGVKHYSKWEDCEPKKLKHVEKREGFLVNECRDWAPDGDIQTGLNKAVLYLAEKYGDPVIVGDDSHFARPEEKIVQDVRLAQSGNWRFATSYHRQSSEESFAYFESKLGMTERRFGAIIDTARDWADRFKGFRFDYKPSLPTKFYEVRYQEQPWYRGADPDNTLRYTFDLIEKHGRMPLGDARAEARLRAEIKLLHHNGTLDLLPYFHLAEDVCSFYEGLGLLTGPGRGSAAGLLLAYLLGITHINPLKYSLSMERFLTEDRIQSGKLPDIDQDLPTRDPLTNPETGWLKQRFGDHYAQISVDTTLKLRMAVKDVARLRYGHVPAKIEELTKKFLLPPQGVNDVDFVIGYDTDEGHHKGSVVPGHSSSDQALQTYAKLYPEDYEIVLKCLGLPRQKGRHACGFVVANCPIPDFIPLTTVGGELVTQYTAAAVEAVGGVKMDFLVLNSLNDVGDCIKLIQERHGGRLTEARVIDGKRVPGHRIVQLAGEEHDVWDLPEEGEVLADISEGRTETVFQLNTPGAIQWLREFNHTKPDGSNIIDSILGIAAFTALDRKGPLEVFVTNPDDGGRHNALVEYARRARGLEGSVDVLPLFNELLPETYGVLVYQEQVQKIYQHLTECSLAEAEAFRGDLAKKKKSKIEKAYALFMERAGAKIGAEKAQGAWDAIQTWSGYGFCLAHAVSYSVIGYACAWLKHHYPLEWWCSVLKNADKNEVSEKFWRHCGKYIDLPDVTLSGESFQIVGDRIRAPINLLHGIGDKAHAQLCRYRPYRDIADFCEKLEHYKDETASWKERVKKEKDENGQTKEVNVTVWERGRSPITRGAVYTMIISGAMDSLFGPDETDVLTKLTRFEEELAKAGKKKRPEKIDPKYLNVGPLVRYQMRKAVLSAYAEDLRPVLAKVRADISSQGGYYHSWTRQSQRWGDTEAMETELVGIDDVEVLNGSRTWSGWISTVAYVVDQRIFSYGAAGEKREACELLLDIDGVNIKLVHWAGKKQHVPEIYRTSLKGALVLTVLSKYKPDRTFAIETMSVVQGPLDHADDTKEPNDRTGKPA